MGAQRAADAAAPLWRIDALDEFEPLFDRLVPAEAGS